MTNEKVAKVVDLCFVIIFNFKSLICEGGVLSDDVISSNVCRYCVILLVMISYLFAFLA